MNFKKIEDTALSHTVSILIGLPGALFGMLWISLGGLIPDDIKNQAIIRIMGALLGSSLLAVAILIAYIVLLERRLKEKPDFSQFAHDPDKACWINKTTGQLICEACKTEGKLIPLSKFGSGWKCPVHPNIVNYHGNRGPTYFDRSECISTIDSP